MNNHYKICLCCHRPFTASRSDQRYCSRRCWHRGNYAYAETLTKVCPVCGKMFETPRTNMVFCGKDCGNAGMKMLGKYTPAKPTYEDLQKSLIAMREMCVKYRINYVAMPQIGCGLDRLEWPKVEKLIRDIFAPTNVNITIYYLPGKNQNHNNG